MQEVLWFRIPKPDTNIPYHSWKWDIWKRAIITDIPPEKILAYQEWQSFCEYVMGEVCWLEYGVHYAYVLATSKERLKRSMQLRVIGRPILIDENNRQLRRPK